MNLSAVILAAGQSRRMGRDKAFIEIEGVPLLARTLGVIREAGIRDVFVSGRPGVDYSRFDAPVLFDLEAGNGPLGGIERGLHAARSPLLLTLAVDMPRMTAELVKWLANACGGTTGVVPRAGGNLEPLAAIYPRRCHAIALQFLQSARRSARDFAGQCAQAGLVTIVDVPSVLMACFANWNDPQDVALKP